MSCFGTTTAHERRGIKPRSRETREATESQATAWHAEYYSGDKSSILFSDLFARSIFVHSAEKSGGDSNYKELPQLSLSDHRASAPRFPAGRSYWENPRAAQHRCSSHCGSTSWMLLSRTLMTPQRNVPPI